MKIKALVAIAISGILATAVHAAPAMDDNIGNMPGSTQLAENSTSGNGAMSGMSNMSGTSSSNMSGTSSAMSGSSSMSGTSSSDEGNPDTATGDDY